jgi:predicted ATPase/DNA-binding CsgD family transcriptional regulator
VLRRGTAFRARQDKIAPLVPHNLPRQLTSFVGREAEAAQVVALLDQTTLLTLAGPGGVGKTRLALQVADRQVSEFPDGVWFVDLGALRDSTLVPQAVATVLGVHDDGARPVVDTLGEVLRSREVLLIMDNCDHLIDACAAVVDALRAACPDLRVLATSREPLNVGGEMVWRVKPLSVDPDTWDGAASQRVTVIPDAVRLFLDRAAAWHLNEPWSERESDCIVRICRRLDGIPLAIELAAARARALPVQEIENQLANRFQILGGGSRSLPKRLQSLETMVDWSYDLLSESEQCLFRRLGIFAGSWSLQAAEHVCVWDGVDHKNIVDLHARLVDKSLVVIENSPEEARFRMLETLREYALAKLDLHHERQAQHLRHADFFVELSENAERGMLARQQQSFARLLREHDNIRAALRWLIDKGDSHAEQAWRMGGALRPFWTYGGIQGEGRVWLDELVAVGNSLPPSVSRGKMLFAAANFHHKQANFDVARRLGERLLAEAISVKDGQLARWAYMALGVVALSRGSFPEALTFAELAGPPVPAIAGSERDLWNPASETDAGQDLLLVMEVACRRGDWKLAISTGHELLTKARDWGFVQMECSALIALGAACQGQGKLSSARQYLDQAESTARNAGDQWRVAQALVQGAKLQVATGEPRRAQGLLAKSLRIARELGYRLEIVQALDVLGCAMVAMRDLERAWLIWAGVAELLEQLGARRSPANVAFTQPYRDSTITKLGRARVESADVAGRSMSLDQLVGLAQPDATGSPTPSKPSNADAEQSTTFGLTAREREVVALLADGLSNREIADRLVISESTAQVHVKRVLSKLQLSSRSRVAAWVHQHPVAVPNSG